MRGSGVCLSYAEAEAQTGFEDGRTRFNSSNIDHRGHVTWEAATRNAALRAPTKTISTSLSRTTVFTPNLKTMKESHAFRHTESRLPDSHDHALYAIQPH